MVTRIGLVIAIMCCAGTASAQIAVPGANGSDGALNPGSNVTIDLSLAATGAWDGANPSPGAGVYDPDQWAVVFRYTGVTIPAGVTVKFKNHPSRAPVVWLVSGNVTISGTIDLGGGAGHVNDNVPIILAEPGPGGFRGSRGELGLLPGTAGMGPGGGSASTGNEPGGRAGHGSAGSLPLDGPMYNNPTIIPLIGGSGGAPYQRSTYNIDGGGGAGGGAILIAVTQSMVVNGAIRAVGGGGGNVAQGGSGGAIRLVADSVSGTGMLRAHGGVGYNAGSGDGRIRVEANTFTLGDQGIPALSFALVGASAKIFPAASDPKIRIVSVGGAGAPLDPRGNILFPLPDISIANASPQIVVEGRNVPLTWIMEVRAVPIAGGPDIVVTAAPSGSLALSTWTATIPTLPNGVSVFQVRAYAP